MYYTKERYIAMFLVSIGYAAVCYVTSLWLVVLYPLVYSWAYSEVFSHRLPKCKCGRANEAHLGKWSEQGLREVTLHEFCYCGVYNSYSALEKK